MSVLHNLSSKISTDIISLRKYVMYYLHTVLKLWAWPVPHLFRGTIKKGFQLHSATAV